MTSDVRPIPPRVTTCERYDCTAYRHEHRDEAGEWIVCAGCGKPAHRDSVVNAVQHDDGSSCDAIAAREWPEIVVHTFGSTSTAYDMTQTCDDIRDGDVLDIPNERVVGVLVGAYPVGITADFGDLHGLTLAEGQERRDAWAALDGGKYAASYRAAVGQLTVDLHEVVRILIEDLNVVAYVGCTSGGQVICVGEAQPDEYGDRRYACLAGPGQWQGPAQHSLGLLGDFFVGPDDNGNEYVVPVAELGAETPREVAALIVRQVNGERVNPVQPSPERGEGS